MQMKIINKKAMIAIPIGLGILELSLHAHWKWLMEMLRAVGSIGIAWVIVWVAGIIWERCQSKIYNMRERGSPD
jgi:uncharacterized membrane protein